MRPELWTTADYALIVSLGSLAISLVSLGWNVWSKFIYPKPRLEITCAVMSSYSSEGIEDEIISVSMVNHGPGEITVRLLVLDFRPTWRRKDRKLGIINPLHNYPIEHRYTQGPFSGGLPKKIEVGEEFAVYLPLEVDDLTSKDCRRLGITDTFSRTHWVRSKTFSRLKAQITTRPKAVKRQMQASPHGQ